MDHGRSFKESTSPRRVSAAGVVWKRESCERPQRRLASLEAFLIFEEEAGARQRHAQCCLLPTIIMQRAMAHEMSQVTGWTDGAACVDQRKSCRGFHHPHSYD